MDRPPKQTPNLRCGWCGEGCVCQHGYCEVCMPCADCMIEEQRQAQVERQNAERRGGKKESG